MIVADMQDGYIDLIHDVLANGSEVSPRGMRTLEVAGWQVCLEDPKKAFPVGIGRLPSHKIGAAESACLIAGVADAELMQRAGKQFKHFVEFEQLYGAYGPRVYRQVPIVIKSICRDPDTRQAGMTIFRTGDNAVGTRDLPCTLNLWYMLRDGKLNAFTTMRSNDLVWGVTYDFLQFCHLQRAIAWALGVEVGSYHHFAYSAHVYIDRDQEIVDRLHPYDGTTVQPLGPVQDDYELGLRDEKLALQRWDRVQRAFERVVGCDRQQSGEPPSGKHFGPWHYEQLRPMHTRRRRCKHCRQAMPDSYMTSRNGSPCIFCLKDRRYSLPIGTTYALMVRHSGACASCGVELDPTGGNQSTLICVDHDHETGKVRGLLCKKCNFMIGLADDDVRKLKGGINYLESLSDTEEYLRCVTAS